MTKKPIIIKKSCIFSQLRAQINCNQRTNRCIKLQTPTYKCELIRSKRYKFGALFDHIFLINKLSIRISQSFITCLRFEKRQKVCVQGAFSKVISVSNVDAHSSKIIKYIVLTILHILEVCELSI